MHEPYVHESSFVDEGARIGAGPEVWHFFHVMGGAVIGERCNLGQNVVVINGVRLGDNVKVQNNVSIYEGVELEDDTFCGPSMVFTNVMNPRSHVSRKHEFRRTLVKRGASIGANATLVCGATLGASCFTGAGAVITKDLLPYAMMAGVPARRIGWMCQCGEKLNASGTGSCAGCGATNEQAGEGIRPVVGARVGVTPAEGGGEPPSGECRVALVGCRLPGLRTQEEVLTAVGDQLDVVAICTPSGLHPEHGIVVSKAGKPAVTEKPTAARLEYADALVHAYDEAGVRQSAKISETARISALPRLST